ncbi:MAG: FAD-dependent oxidoreductase [Bryobacterales bacterium]|nr:FAD-dependent oxidoreductase [Bryobacterales bacterium]
MAANASAAFAQTGTRYDFAIVGAGVFGTWLARALHLAGKKVLLVDQHGAANNRASSGGETRIIRFGYGDRELYTRWSQRALALYKAAYAGLDPLLFVETGFLWLARQGDAYTESNLEVFDRLKVQYEKLDRSQLEQRFPQISLGPVTWGIYEPEAGGLLARRGVQTVLEATRKQGLAYQQVQIVPPREGSRTASIRTADGDTIDSETLVYACGPWLPKIFPEILGNRIRPTRQEVFYFGLPPGDPWFRVPKLPAWVDPGDTMYGLPDIENRGFKICPDQHGSAVDPDTQERLVPAVSVTAMRAYMTQRFPRLANAPLTQTEVCQYENTSNGDYLMDRHPGFDNVWLLGGGSGHGYKHGPAIGEYMTEALLEGKAIDRRFSLATKDAIGEGGRTSTIPAPRQ